MALSHLMAGMGTRPHLSKPAGDHQSVSYRPHSNSTNQNPKQRRIDLYLLLLFSVFLFAALKDTGMFLPVLITMDSV